MSRTRTQRYTCTHAPTHPSDEYPQDTCAQVLSLTFGLGPCATLLFVGLDDDSVTVIDTEGVCLCLCFCPWPHLWLSFDLRVFSHASFLTPTRVDRCELIRTLVSTCYVGGVVDRVGMNVCGGRRRPGADARTTLRPCRSSAFGRRV